MCARSRACRARDRRSISYLIVSCNLGPPGPGAPRVSRDSRGRRARVLRAGTPSRACSRRGTGPNTRKTVAGPVSGERGWAGGGGERPRERIRILFGAPRRWHSRMRIVVLLCTPYNIIKITGPARCVRTPAGAVHAFYLNVYAYTRAD